MRRTLIVLTVALCGTTWCTAAGGDRVETGEMAGNRFIDARHGFNFEKPHDWKLTVLKEAPVSPSPCRVELRREGIRTLKRVIISGFRKRGASRPEPLDLYEKPTISGGLYVDTTSLDINEFKQVIVGERGGRDQHPALGELVDFLRHSICVRQKLARLGELGVGYELGFRAAVAANPVSSLIHGEVYFTVNAGKVYLFYFSFRQTDFFDDCRSEIERMVNSLAFPEKGRHKSAMVLPVPSGPPVLTTSICVQAVEKN